MRRPQKPCNKVGCPNLTRERFCEDHQSEPTSLTKRYNQTRDPKHVMFYGSKEWKFVRAQALLRDHYLCVHCKRERTITRADVVDHIVEVRDDWSQRLVLDNLQSLCHGCHNQKTAREKSQRMRS